MFVVEKMSFRAAWRFPVVCIARAARMFTAKGFIFWVPSTRGELHAAAISPQFAHTTISLTARPYSRSHFSTRTSPPHILHFTAQKSSFTDSRFAMTKAVSSTGWASSSLLSRRSNFFFVAGTLKQASEVLLRRYPVLPEDLLAAASSYLGGCGCSESELPRPVAALGLGQHRQLRWAPRCPVLRHFPLEVQHCG